MLVTWRPTRLVNAVAFLAVVASSIIEHPLHARSFDEAHDEYVYRIALSHDGRLMATASGDNTVVLWDTQQRIALHVLPHDAAVYTVAMSPDGQSIATGSGDGYVALWNTREGRCVVRTKRHDDAVYSVAFSPDGQQLASAGGSTEGGDTACRISRVVDLQLLTSLTGHSRQVYGVVFSPDGQKLATSSSDKTIRLWNLASRQCTVLPGHTSDVYRCAFSPDGRQLASTGQDGTVRLWNLETGKAAVLIDLTKKSPIYAATFSHDGSRLAAVGDDCHLRIWRTTNGRLTWEQKVAPCALYSVGFLGTPTVVAAGENGSIYAVSTSSDR
ncbi:MAG: WD40 repeat domain-containing protein [Planctomycetales bacterium]|nr:WD40 repeat domain-containing protein [Planctomycetales bacterium]